MNSKLTLFVEEIPLFHKEIEGKLKLQDICGEKAYNLSKLKSFGIDVPPTFSFTPLGRSKLDENSQMMISESLWQQIMKSVRSIEDLKSKKFGNKNPLFLNIQGSIPCSCVYYIGMNDMTVRELGNDSQDFAFAYSCYSNFISTFSTMVLGIPIDAFHDILDQLVKSRNYSSKREFKPQDWIYLSKLFKALVVKATGRPFPQDVNEQLRRSITSVYGFSKSEAGQKFMARMCTTTTLSVVISQSVFGNYSPESASLVISTHNVIDGSVFFNGRYLKCADVIDVASESLPTENTDKLVDDFPELYQRITDYSRQLCKTFHQPISISFVFERGNLYAISTDTPPFAGLSRLKASIAFNESKEISNQALISLLQPRDVVGIVSQEICETSKGVLGSGFPSGNGATKGKVCISNNECIELSKIGVPVVLFKKHIHVSDLKALLSAVSVVTCHGNNLSASSLLVRSLGIPSVIGCEDISINYQDETIESKGLIVKVGDDVTVENGKVLIGSHNMTPNKLSQDNDAKKIMMLADSSRKGRFNIYSISQSSSDVKNSQIIGADGVGLLSIDSLFKNSIESLSRFLCDPHDKLLQNDIETRIIAELSDAFYFADQRVIIIQLIDDAITKYMPSIIQLTHEVSVLKTKKKYDPSFKDEGTLFKKESLLSLVQQHGESNPLMGLRGARLMLANPSIFITQIRAILLSIASARRRGSSPIVRILVPLVSDPKEMVLLREIMYNVQNDICEKIELGAFIETPRAIMLCKEIAKASDFMCFDVYSLSQFVYGIFEEDAKFQFLSDYIEQKSIDPSPFIGIDETAVKELILIGIKRAKEGNPKIPIGAIGRQICSKEAIDMLCKNGFSYITCLPSFVPVAKLCVSQSLLGIPENK